MGVCVCVRVYITQSDRIEGKDRGRREEEKWDDLREIVFGFCAPYLMPDDALGVSGVW